MSNKKLSNLKPIISVTNMAKALNHSRARFYQLQQEQIYPPPIYDIRTKRPFYDVRLQKICHEVRQTGIGWNGQYILFYSARKTSTVTSQKGSKHKTQKKNSKHKELVETLTQMGLDITDNQVEQAIQELYPDGYENEDIGIVIRDLFRHFRK